MVGRKLDEYDSLETMRRIVLTRTVSDAAERPSKMRTEKGTLNLTT